MLHGVHRGCIEYTVINELAIHTYGPQGLSSMSVTGAFGDMLGNGKRARNHLVMQSTRSLKRTGAVSEQDSDQMPQDAR